MPRGKEIRHAPLLDVEGLSVTLETSRGPAAAVREVSFSLAHGETLGLVGESGSGKSMTALAILGLLPEGAGTAGRVLFEGRDLLGLDERTLCRVRGDRIGVVFQEPMTALNPLHTIGRQIAETLVLHRGAGAGEARREAVRLLDRVGIADAARRVDAYPHQLSGGQRQRVTIAIALACGPELLIADEPTTALDVTIQRQILDLIADLVDERGMALLLISHDLGVVAENAERMLVMYGGSIVESGTTDAVFARPSHPYTRGLFGARPRLGGGRGVKLTTIGGTVPELADMPKGCPFAGRCPLTIEACGAALPALEAVAPGHGARCIRLEAAGASA
jgi:peptide/nickel transport system ATP-binding protein